MNPVQRVRNRFVVKNPKEKRGDLAGAWPHGLLNSATVRRRSITYAKSAYDLLSNDHKAKKAYALNQYLYYLVEGGGDDRKKEMFDAARTLLLAEVGRKTWQYRFDDTMARYFHRLACAAKSEG